MLVRTKKATPTPKDDIYAGLDPSWHKETLRWAQWCRDHCPQILNFACICHYTMPKSSYKASEFEAMFLLPNEGWERWETSEDSEHFQIWVNLRRGIVISLEDGGLTVTWPRDAQALREYLDEQHGYFWPRRDSDGHPIRRAMAKDIHGDYPLPT